MNGQRVVMVAAVIGSLVLNGVAQDLPELTLEELNTQYESQKAEYKVADDSRKEIERNVQEEWAVSEEGKTLSAALDAAKAERDAVEKEHNDDDVLDAPRQALA